MTAGRLLHHRHQLRRRDHLRHLARRPPHGHHRPRAGRLGHRHLRPPHHHHARHRLGGGCAGIPPRRRLHCPPRPVGQDQHLHQHQVGAGWIRSLPACLPFCFARALNDHPPAHPPTHPQPPFTKRGQALRPGEPARHHGQPGLRRAAQVLARPEVPGMCVCTLVCVLCCGLCCVPSWTFWLDQKKDQVHPFLSVEPGGGGDRSTLSPACRSVGLTLPLSFLPTIKINRQLRYTGGMVPDVNQILVKGKGVFVNPEVRTHERTNVRREVKAGRQAGRQADTMPSRPVCPPALRCAADRPHSPPHHTPPHSTLPQRQSPSAKAKLRLLYEVAPIGYLVEKAGGASSYGAGSVLDLKIYKTEDRTQVCEYAYARGLYIGQLLGCWNQTAAAVGRVVGPCGVHTPAHPPAAPLHPPSSHTNASLPLPHKKNTPIPPITGGVRLQGRGGALRGVRRHQVRHGAPREPEGARLSKQSIDSRELRKEATATDGLSGKGGLGLVCWGRSVRFCRLSDRFVRSRVCGGRTRWEGGTGGWGLEIDHRLYSPAAVNSSSCRIVLYVLFVVFS